MLTDLYDLIRNTGEENKMFSFKNSLNFSVLGALIRIMKEFYSFDIFIVCIYS